MSKLNPNAGEWVPTFVAPVVAVSPATTASPLEDEMHPNGDMTMPTNIERETSLATSRAHQNTPLEHVTEFRHDMEGDSPLQDRFMYSKEYLLAFQPVGDDVITSIPDVVRNPTPLKKVGKKVGGRLVYTIAELLQFQPLYEMMPKDFSWADTIGADAIMCENKGKKGKKDKIRQQRENAMSYDASLVFYFNPTEYSAAMNRGLYTGPPAETTVKGFDGKSKVHGVEPVNQVEEAIIARRRVATLLDDVRPDTIFSILESFMSITISCIHTLQEIIGQLFDHAIANPELSDSCAELCTGLSKQTPEFKDGAKTINFRRILLTKCYESLIEEPDSQTSHLISKNVGINGATQHSWRRKCMLQNVGFIGDLFRRQLLTENIMHVCVAMMLDDEMNPQSEIIEAACGLLNLVGDLLDGSSPASRRTMDEYFAVLVRIKKNCQLPDHVKKLITQLKTVRASGWLKIRQDDFSASHTLTSPAKLTRCESSGTANSPAKAAPITALDTAEKSIAEIGAQDTTNIRTYN